MVDLQLDIFESPASFHCFGDEDFVGSIKKVAQRSKHPHTLEQRVAEKCRLLAGIDAYMLEHPDLAVPPDLGL